MPNCPASHSSVLFTFMKSKFTKHTHADEKAILRWFPLDEHFNLYYVLKYIRKHADVNI